MKKLKLLLLMLVMSIGVVGCEINPNLTIKTTETITTEVVNGAETSEVLTEELLGDSIHVQQTSTESSTIEPTNIETVPEFTGSPYVIINNNIPNFAEEEITTKDFENYSELDYLGRCQVAITCIGQEIMPTEDRESISHVEPSGWQSEKYDVVSGKYLYNRSHLIGFQLAGENANEKNLITGTRFMNVDGMLPFENLIADYVTETNNHVMYRVTPVFQGEELVARGVQLEAYSVEDSGEGVLFNVYVYNNQPGIEIDYLTGKGQLSNDEAAVNIIEDAVDNEADLETVEENIIEDEIIENKAEELSSTITYILNTDSQKFHYEDCFSADKITDENKDIFTGTREELVELGFDPCGHCEP